MGKPFFRRTFRITRSCTDTARDVHDEIEFHLEMRTQELVDEGWDPVAARRHCMKAFGDRSRIEDACHRIAGTVDRRRDRARAWESVLADLRIAGRDLRRRPVFFAASTLTLTLAMALFTLVYCVADSVLLRPLPYDAPDHLVTIYNSFPKAGAERGMTSAVDFFERRERLETLEAVALFQNRSQAYGEDGAMGRAFSQNVTPSFFDVLGARPLLGTFFGDQELLPGRTPQAVISATLWKRAFANAPDVVGKTLIVGGVPHTVVAVTRPDFSFPDWDADLWLPLAFGPERRAESARLWTNYRMIARLAPGVALEQAQAELSALDAAILERTSPDIANQLTQAGYAARVVPMHEDLVRQVRPWIVLLGVGAAFVLLVAGISLSNLQLVRITGRLPELATRTVLGAGRLRLLRQLLTENLLITVTGASAGIASGVWGLRFLAGFDPWEIPRISQLSLSPVAAGLLIMIALVAMALSSLLASWILRRADLFSLMRQGASTGTGGLGRWRGALVAAQVAVAFILLTGASLLAVSLSNLLAEDLGFDAENVQASALTLPQGRYPSAADRRGFFASLLAEVERLPAVRHAALSTQRPFSGAGSRRVLAPEFRSADGEEGERIASHQMAVSPGYFDALGIRLLTGRTLGSGDRHDTTRVMVVSEAVALRHWPPGQAVGQRVRFDESVEGWWTVVGVVEEIRQESVVEPRPIGAFYLPIEQYDTNFVHLLVRADSLAGLLPALRQQVQKLDPETPLFWSSTLAEDVASSLLSVRLPLQILLIFAGVALALAAVGIFGVLSQAVTCRTKEIGIRLALGGSRRRVGRWVFLHLTRFVVVGWAVGLAAALVFSDVMRSLVFGIRPHEPWVFLAVSGILLTVAYGVALLPASRAMNIDPSRVLTAALVFCCLGSGLLGLAPSAEADVPSPQEEAQQSPTRHVYASPDGVELSLYIFAPPEAADASLRPAMLVFHGGGWTIGSAEWAFPRARHFASLGMVGVAVQYRLTDHQAITPLDAMADTRAAFRWLRVHAAEHGVDPRRVGGYGWSAGAHLVAAAATIPGPETAPVSASPDALILVSPAVAVTESGWMRRNLLDRAAPKDVSPDEFVRPGLPPTIILQGRTDTVTPTPGVERFCQRLARAGNRCDLHIFEDVGHLFTPSSEPDNDWPNPDLQVRARAYRAADEFLASIGWIDRGAVSATGKAGLGETSRYQSPEIDRTFGDLVAKHGITTAGVAVIKRGEVVWQNAYGEQSPGVPASASTLFDVASLTKTVTAETILRLVAAGKLSLDEPLARSWVDPDVEGDPRHRRLTARHALTHTTGFANWRFFAADGKLRFMHDPGTQFGYSGEGFEYLAKYAEKKLGIPFEVLAETYVFEPVGMDAVALSVREAKFPRIARAKDADGTFHGYYCRPEGWCRSEGDFSAAGSMVVTVGDYAKFMISSLRGQGLNAQLVADRDTLQGRQDDIDCTKSPDAACPVHVGYGLGWSILDLGEDRLIGHRGSDWSVVSLAYYYQGSGDGLVVFFNAPNQAGIAAMVEALELLDPGSPELHGYRARRARAEE